MLNIMLGSKIMKGVVSKLISRSIKRKYGYKTDVQLNEIDIRETFDDNIEVKLNVEVEISKADLEKIIDSINEEA